MKLTNKDKLFLERLKPLCKDKELDIILRNGQPPYLALSPNYGDRIESHFTLTRQGVRWRFQRLFNDIYVSAYETIYFVESRFGTGLRKQVLEIVKHRVEMRRKLREMGRL
jgi:hypothetical protein